MDSTVMTATSLPWYLSSTLSPTLVSSQAVSRTMGMPKRRLLPGRRISLTQLVYTSSFMKPVRGLKPPTVSSSTSHAFLSESSRVRLQEETRLAFFDSSAMRFTSLPPWGSMRPAACAAAEEAWKRDLPAVKEPTRPARACGRGKEQQRGQQRSVESELRLRRSTADIRRTADLGVVLGGKSEGENRASGFQCDHDGIAVGSSPRARRSVPPPSPIAGASAQPGRKIFPLSRVFTFILTCARSSPARMAREAPASATRPAEVAAPRGDGGDLAERTADGTHRGHLVRSCCEVSLIRSMLLQPRPRVRVAGLGFVSDCLRVLKMSWGPFSKKSQKPHHTKTVACCQLLLQPSLLDQTTHVAARQDQVLFRCLTLGGPSSPWRSTVRPPPTVR